MLLNTPTSVQPGEVCEKCGHMHKGLRNCIHILDSESSPLVRCMCPNETGEME